METYFAPAKKAGQSELKHHIEIVSNNPVISGLLHSVGGLIAVLNEFRQVVSLNDSFIKMLGIEDPFQTLGLRPGEILACVHSHEKPGGCGTTKYCSTCGAAIAIVSGLNQDGPVERICSLTAHKGDNTVDIVLLVRSHSIVIDQNKFLLLFLQDITQEHGMAALERTFFHDVNNILVALTSTSEMIAEDHPSKLTQTLQRAAERLKNEVAIQQSLFKSESYIYKPLWHQVSVMELLTELELFFSTHPISLNKQLIITNDFHLLTLKTDISLLQRILCNMIINAFEASQEDESIHMWVEADQKQISFCVKNSACIHKNIALRIFQRNFSTKSEKGRGIGTFSMKLFGEQILGGKVTFTTSKKEGTIFRLSLPL